MNKMHRTKRTRGGGGIQKFLKTNANIEALRYCCCCSAALYSQLRSSYAALSESRVGSCVKKEGSAALCCLFVVVVVGGVGGGGVDKCGSHTKKKRSLVSLNTDRRRRQPGEKCVCYYGSSDLNLNVYRQPVGAIHNCDIWILVSIVNTV